MVLELGVAVSRAGYDLLADGQLFVWAFDDDPTLKLDMNVACVEVIAIGVLTPEFRATLKTVE